jgi:hypothetical protein
MPSEFFNKHKILTYISIFIGIVVIVLSFTGILASNDATIRYSILSGASIILILMLVLEFFFNSYDWLWILIGFVMIAIISSGLIKSIPLTNDTLLQLNAKTSFIGFIAAYLFISLISNAIKIVGEFNIDKR